MPLFSLRSDRDTPLKASDLEALHAAVESVRADLAAHRAVSDAQGKMLATLPAEVLRRFEAEVSNIAGGLAMAALKRAREEVVGSAIKWGVRALLGAAGTYVVTQWSALLGALHK